jgi:protein TonB
MTTVSRPIGLDGRTLAVAASIGLHLVLLAVSGGRVPRMVPREQERLAFTVVARPPPEASPAPARAASAPARTDHPRTASAPAPSTMPSPVPSPVEAAADAPAAPSSSDERGGGAPAESSAVAGGSTMGGASTATSNGEGFDPAGYGRGLHGLVAAKKQYPVLARRMGLEGVTRLRVRVRPDGTLDGPPVVTTSSGHDLLDREALRMVAAAAPFPTFTDAGRAALSLVLSVRFALDEG